MRLLNRKSPLQKLLDGIAASNPLKGGIPNDKALKAGGLIAGGLAGLTAGSAGISSLRRRTQGARGDS